MIRYDIVIVTCNSAKWMKKCLQALANVAYPKTLLNIIISDNKSSQEEIVFLKQLQKEHENIFGSIRLVLSDDNKGFGAGCNHGAKAGNSEFIFMLNADTEICPDALELMEDAIASAPAQTAAFEMKQLPYEQSKYYNPATLECTWNSGACVVYKREVYEEVGGYDENIFMYSEDVDISWRIRALGYRLLYVPKACVIHHCESNEKNDFFMYYSDLYSKLLLGYKYGAEKQAIRHYLRAIKRPRHFPHVRQILVKNFFKHFFHIHKFKGWSIKHKDLSKKAPADFSENYGPVRGTQKYPPLKDTPLVSVIVRTYNRKNSLRLTLRSLQNQTYNNFEVIVAEDGNSTARKVAEEFTDLNITYINTGKKIGRSKTGNLALSRARGEYFNFLDDDDFFYPEHLELLTGLLQNTPKADMAAASCLQLKTRIHCLEPQYQFDIKEIIYIPVARIDPFTFCKRNLTPILSVLFHRKFYDQMGGLREDIDTAEDWAMWLRYMTMKPAYVTTPRATCAYTVPYDNQLRQDKLNSYAVNEAKVYEDPDLRFDLSAEELKDYYDMMLSDIRHFHHVGTLEEYLNRIQSM